MPAPTPAPKDSARSASRDEPADTPADAASPADQPEAAGPAERRPPQALTVPMNRIARKGAIAVGVALPVATLIGYLVGGSAGAWGALLGMGIAVGFFGITIVVALATARTRDAGTLGLAVLASWLVKIVLLIVILAFLRGQEFYSPGALFVSLLVGTFGTLIIEWRVVTTTRVPYVEPDQR